MTTELRSFSQAWNPGTKELWVIAEKNVIKEFINASAVAYVKACWTLTDGQTSGLWRLTEMLLELLSEPLQQQATFDLRPTILHGHCGSRAPFPPPPDPLA